MTQKSTNRMENSLSKKRFTTKVACLLFVLALSGISFTQAQRVINSTEADQDQSFSNERNPGGTPIRNNNGINVVVCPTITSLNMQDMGFDKALVTWTNMLSFDSIVFRVTNIATSNSRVVMIPGTPNPGLYFIQGLSPLTTYEISVSTICAGGGGHTTWSPALQVTTLQPPPPRFASPQQQRNFNLLTIAPNPASTTTTISFMASSTLQQQVMITNASGQVMYKKSLIPNTDKVQMTIDVSHFPIGVYAVKVSSSAGTSVERLIVQ